MEAFFAIFIVAGLMWIFLTNPTRLPDQATFQRMADEYSKDGAFIDSMGVRQTNADILIDLYFAMNETPTSLEEQKTLTGVSNDNF